MINYNLLVMMINGDAFLLVYKGALNQTLE
jgi:hypothetical protein